MRLLAALALIAWSSAVSAAELDLQSQTACSGTLLLEAGCSEKGCSRSTSARFSAPGTLRAPEGIWRATVVDGGCWAPPFQTTSEKLAVTLVPFAPRSGGLSTKTLPRHVTSSIRIAGRREWIRNTAACELRGQAWRCDVPVSAKDLRIESDGHSSAYYFHISDEPLAQDLGIREIVPGASIVATVRGPAGWPEKAIEVTAHAPKTGERHRSKRIGENTFQITSLAAETYQVTAGAKHLSTAPVEINAAEMREYAVGDLTLRQLASLYVSVTPAPLAEGPWKIRLLQREENGQTLRAVREGELDELGTWTAEGVELGPHVVTVLDQKNAIVHQENADVGTDRAVVAITLEHVPVRGTVSAGSDALESVVQFERAGARIEFTTDHRGEFGGMLPQAGTWQVHVTPEDKRQRLRLGTVDVHRAPSEAFVRVDLRLPEGRVRGAVVNHLGEPVAGAEILVMRGSKIAGSVLNGADGRFEMLGVEDGAVTLTAYGESNESAPASYQVSEDPPEVTLVLQDRVAVEGRVITENGRPLPGAIIRYLTETAGASEAVTDPSGRFSLRVPAGTAVDMVTLAPGYPIQLQRFVITASLRPVIRLSRVPGTVIISMNGAPPWPFVAANGAAIPLPAFFRPRSPGTLPAEASDAGFVLELEPGEYALCADRTQRGCIASRVPPAARVQMDARPLWSQSK